MSFKGNVSKEYIAQCLEYTRRSKYNSFYYYGNYLTSKTRFACMYQKAKRGKVNGSRSNNEKLTGSELITLFPISIKILTFYLLVIIFDIETLVI